MYSITKRNFKSEKHFCRQNTVAMAHRVSSIMSCLPKINFTYISSRATFAKKKKKNKIQKTING